MRRHSGPNVGASLLANTRMNRSRSARLRPAIALALWTLLSACTHPSAPLTHDAYIWQRQWTPSLRESVASSADLVRDWRVLVAQADNDGSFHVFTPDRAALAATGRPVVFVVRIDGRLSRFDEASLVSRVVTLVRETTATAAGVEIDYDCPTARLPAYASFLRHLKGELGGVPLSITALPTWIGSPELDTVLAVPDESVLQVHAVQAPQAGLFDPDVAMGWIDDFARHTHKPFRVALPTYGSRVSWNADGTLLAVESEQGARAAGAIASELYASPVAVRGVVDRLARARPAGLVGVTWFRLPTPEDTRAWSLATWRGVVTGKLDAPALRATLRPGTGDAAADVLIDNPGGIDAVAPVAVRLPHGCDVADGVDGYVVRRTDDGLELVSRQARPLPAHVQRPIGWARCPAGSPVTLSIRAEGAPLS
ncbi:Protein of unknown function [Dyella sp. 333MFSha]|nr:Protein of unknown function [Dyella sp. 333MFSha]